MYIQNLIRGFVFGRTYFDFSPPLCRSDARSVSAGIRGGHENRHVSGERAAGHAANDSETSEISRQPQNPHDDQPGR